MKGWYSEISTFWPGQALALEVEEVLHHEKTEYQALLLHFDLPSPTFTLPSSFVCGRTYWCSNPKPMETYWSSTEASLTVTSPTLDHC